MARGTLERGQAEAIRFLVSSAVAGVAPEAVAVIDAAQGVVLAGKDDPLTGGETGPTARAETMRANIQRLLEARVGPGRAIVEVNVDADMDSQTITERTIDPESRVAISSELEESSETASGSAPGVTVASNLPDGDVGGGGNDSQRSATESKERQNYEVSETRRERVILPGQIRKVSVAVMVDGIVAGRRRRQGDMGTAPGRGDGDAAPARPLGDRLRRGTRRHRHHRGRCSSPCPPNRARSPRAPGRASSTSGAGGWPSSACSARSCSHSSSSSCGR